MKNMKRLTALTLVAVMAASLVGCGSVAKNTVNSKDDLKGKVIGVQLGTTGDIYATSYADESNTEQSTEGAKKAAKTTVDRYNKGADAVQALKQGKADAVLIDEQPAKAFVAKNDDLKILDAAFADEQYAICVAKNKTDLTKQLNQAIADLKKDGTLDKIISNYIGDDTKGKTPYKSPANVDHSKGTLTMATNAEFEPYEFHKGGNVTGIDVDLATAICDKLGYSLKVDDMKFDSIITAVESGKADFGAAGMTVTDDRKKNIDFTDPYTTARQVIIVRKK
jgi:polar amino acid transport system substrate-binding protein